MKKYLVIVGMMVFVTPPTSASLQSSMESWMSDSEYVNVNSPSAYESQAGGYGVSFGGIRYRTASQEVGNFVSYRSPKMSAGCGGIDLDLGGFNFVNKDQIVQQLRAIGQNAKGLIFQMAIKTISSMLGGEMEVFKQYADKLNSMQMDSCAAASSLLKAGGDMIGSMEVKRCVEAKIDSGGMSYDQARTACTSGGARAAINSDPARTNIDSFTTGNYAWMVMMQDPFFKANKDVAMLMMNVTGTIIITPPANVPAGTDPNEVQPQYTFIPSWFMSAGGDVACLSTTTADETCESANAKVLRELLVYGKTKDGATSSLKMFTCAEANPAADETGCKDIKRDGDNNPVYADVALSLGSPIRTQYRDLMNSILTKMASRDGAALTDPEKNLIGMIDGPIYRYMLASTSVLRSAPTNDDRMNTYLDALAEKIVAQRMADMGNKVRNGLVAGKYGVNMDEKKKEYLKSVENTVMAFSQIGVNADKRLSVMLDMENRAGLYEKVLVGNLTTAMMSRAQFGR